ncbi:MAG: transmembrane anchor protein [Alphaproteobacteria bacterium HGW-Alphaproteobacteria-18]|nr:MAG: transmembrane anchor protein [Alphaproteobacteria bacterium HGW-Alphaproteobacteria-18]
MYNTELPTRTELPTTHQLIRSTLIALGAAAVLLVTVILPAEYAVDPTGAGRVLGLTQMGEIKQQLAAEAEADAAITIAAAGTVPEAQAEESVPSEEANEPSAPVSEQSAPAWRDEVLLTLAPGQAAEIKLVMKQGEAAGYDWVVDRGHVNSDLHGDGTSGQSTSYRKGRAEQGDSGKLTAAFDGSHGWFWRNRSDVSVTIRLRTNGTYSELKRVV